MRGRLIFNGNIQAEADFVTQARDYLLESRHMDAEVADRKKVLLVTAGWLEREYDETHIKEALLRIGIPSRLEDGYEQNIQNLSLYHHYQDFLRARPDLAEAWRERELLIGAAQQLYQEKNSFYVQLLRRWLERARGYLPRHNLSNVWNEVHRTRDFLDGQALVGHFIARDLHDNLLALIHNDDRLVALLRDLDQQFVRETGLHLDKVWQSLREDLVERILSSNSIFLFGGHLAGLHRCLSFFRLREVLVEALRRGTSFYTVSAGSLVCCERVIVYDDFGPKREFQLFHRGFGLIRHLQLFPHCDDRIQTDDPDNLAYLAQRFRSRTCVGLNEESILLLERDRCVSVGKGDGVYVFDTSGQKVRYDFGEEIPLPA